ncbi:MAG TPA: addiction module protein [Pyrinomonadaceae bacterium]|jgi:putative addiction module component (TIGR02574 family)|nr:addiction module protein [Pyrinomonadaceae bacterium]
MATEVNQLVREALELSDEDRAMLAGLLINSLEDQAGADPGVEEAWAVETERRWREIESGTVETIPWEEVKAKLFRQR